MLRDGRSRRSVGIIHCVGSRDDNTNRWCSQVCCMYSLKLAHLVRRSVPEPRSTTSTLICVRRARATRSSTTGCWMRACTSCAAAWPRSPTGPPTPRKKGKLVIRAEDTLAGFVRRDSGGYGGAVGGTRTAGRRSGRAPALQHQLLHGRLVPGTPSQAGAREHLYRRRLIAGACQGPKDIPDSVAQAGAAAAEALALIDARLRRTGAQHRLRPGRGLLWLQDLHPALPLLMRSRSSRRRKRRRSTRCCAKGCGTCVAACPSGSIAQNLFEDEEIFEEIEGVLAYA